MSIYFKRKKDPDEKVLLTFDFTNELAADEVLTGTPVVKYATVEGTDASPGDIANGGGAVNGQLDLDFIGHQSTLRAWTTSHP